MTVSDTSVQLSLTRDCSRAMCRPKRLLALVTLQQVLWLKAEQKGKGCPKFHGGSLPNRRPCTGPHTGTTDVVEVSLLPLGESAGDPFVALELPGWGGGGAGNASRQLELGRLPARGRARTSQEITQGCDHGQLDKSESRHPSRAAHWAGVGVPDCQWEEPLEASWLTVAGGGGQWQLTCQRPAPRRSHPPWTVPGQPQHALKALPEDHMTGTQGRGLWHRACHGAVVRRRGACGDRNHFVTTGMCSICRMARA
jgi:hypothetical protein